MTRVKLLTVCLLMCICSHLHATGINFLESTTWKEVLAQAKKENKLIFLDAYASWCGPCKYLQNEVFTDEKAGAYYNKTFINVKMDMEEGEGIRLAEQLEVQSYPTLFFINGDGQVLHKKIGAMEVAEFLELGANATQPDRQFYTVKKKAGTGNLLPADFHRWLHDADDLDDPDVATIAGSYLAAAKYPRMEKEMLSIMLDHASLNEEQLKFIAANKEKCQALSGKTGEGFTMALLNRVNGYAARQSMKNEQLDAAAFQKIVHAYFPERAAIETEKMKIRYFYFADEFDKSLDVLAACIATPALKLKAEELSDYIVTYIKVINNQKRTDEFIQKVGAYKLLPEEATQVYRKDLALLALYLAKEDRLNVETYGKKILDDRQAPDEIKARVRKVLDN